MGKATVGLWEWGNGETGADGGGWAPKIRVRVSSGYVRAYGHHTEPYRQTRQIRYRWQISIILATSRHVDAPPPHSQRSTIPREHGIYVHKPDPCLTPILPKIQLFQK